MSKNKILVFAGTSEGRILSEQLSQKGYLVTCSIATEYGLQPLEHLKNVNIICKRLDAKEIIELINKEKFSVVIDATHPYAKVVTENIIYACKNTNVQYLRLLRKEIHYDNVITLPSTKKAAEFLCSTKGNILLTTGSKELALFSAHEDIKNRIFARVLPSSDVLKHCEELGLKGKQIIAMQGPFLKETNIALLKQFNCDYLVTKNSGEIGGLNDKILAAEETKATIIMIDRPLKENGYSLEEIASVIERNDF